MRIHVAPAFPASAHPQYDWFREGFRQNRSKRHEWAELPDDSDAILLTDLGAVISHARFERRALELLAHPLVRAHRSRCFVYHEQDVPRPGLPGLYAYMEWFPGVESVSAAIAPAEHLENAPNPHVSDRLPPPDRDLLMSFQGRDCHPVRERLLRLGGGRNDIVLTDTSDRYDHYATASDASMAVAYAETMRRSRWALCPRGWSTGSRRLFEAMRMGIAPVVISDGWTRPAGPDWGQCCLWLPEADLPDLVRVLEARGDDWYTMGLAAQEAYQRFFAPPVVFDHALDELASLRERWGAVSRVGAIRRQWREFVVHAIGLTSPAIRRARKRGRATARL